MLLQPARIEAFACRAPVETPVQTSFGIMRDRPAVFVRITDADGAEGWGEVWCNFPTVGAEHRARLVDSVFAPLLLGKAFESPAAAFAELTQQTTVLAIQAAEPGPIAQCIAGLDIALWDLHARRSGQPLWRLLGGAAGSVPVYASGLNPTAPEALAAQKRAEGYGAFKLKIGFGLERDRANLKALRSVTGDGPLMVDANQAWDLETSITMAAALQEFDLAWLEEPLRADRPWPEWQQLAKRCGIGLAAGENLASDDAFDAAIGSRALAVVQPDIAKWGGFSACLPVARKIRAAGLRYCPHYLGAGIGLLASAHLLAAVGGDGMLEIDANPNPLRALSCDAAAQVVDGRIDLGAGAGLGSSLDPATFGEFRVPH
ncbi:MAG TPA: mandelate racemase/muconate lactonizing enzyme family protein [Burkholderiales bacterium]